MLSPTLWGQFYNGSDLDFGQNRVQDFQFDWRKQQYERFSMHYYRGEEEFAEWSAKLIHEEWQNLEEQFNLVVDEHLDFMIFKSLSEMRRANIGLFHQAEKLGGSSQLFENKILLFYPGTQIDFRNQIREILAKRMIQLLLFGENWASIVNGADHNKHPIWFVDGLSYFISEEWNSSIESQIKDGILSGEFQNLAFLNDGTARIAGYALWWYISEVHGYDEVLNVLYATRPYEHVGRAIEAILGSDIQELMPLIIDYYKEKFQDDLLRQNELSGQTLQLKDRGKSRIGCIDSSPDESQMAYVLQNNGAISIMIHDFKTGKNKRIDRFGPKIKRLQDYSSPVIAFHPSGEFLAVFIEISGNVLFKLYDFRDGSKTEKVLPNLQKVSHMSYSKNGQEIILSGINNGQSDIYLYRIAGNNLDQITDDLYEDMYPEFMLKEDHISFMSNRSSTNIRNFTGVVPASERQELLLSTQDFALFQYDLKKRNKSRVELFSIPLNDGHTSYIKQTKADEFLYLNDENGLKNLSVLKIDSTISSVDTIIKYRYLYSHQAITNTQTGLLNWTKVNNKEILVLLYENQEYKIARQEIPSEILGLEKSYFSSLNENRLEAELETPDPEVNEEKLNSYKYYSNDDSTYIKEVFVLFPNSQELNNPDTLPEYLSPRRERYLLNFAKKKFHFSVENSFLSQAYQTYTPNQAYANPQISALTEVDLSDLFEDFILKGAFRVPMSRFNSEQLLVTEFNKNRLDKVYRYYRRTSSANSPSGLVKVSTHNLAMELIYPFNEVSSVHFTLNNRLDINRPLYYNISDFEKENEIQFKTGTVFSYVFDNSHHRSANSWSGIKFKTFLEYQQAPESASFGMLNIGFDFRHGKTILSEMVWVNRLAASTSLGNERLLYYIGGVDNWITIPGRAFNNNMPVNPSASFAFQTIATPLRGFQQNQRNGNSFFIYNSELRIPLFQLLVKHTVKNEPLRSFQLIPFFDLGSAWTGPSPLSEENHFNKLSISNKPVTTILVNSREPIVAGTGFGLRSKIFGYFVRVDFGWGIEDFQISNFPKLYLSLAYDL
jgi:WD40 repeat protein